MQIDFKKIILLLVISSIVGLIFNYLNPAGISLIRKEKKLSFASDSLITQELNQEEETPDIFEINEHLERFDKEQIISDEVKDTLKEVETGQKNTKIENNIKREENTTKIVVEPVAIKLEQAFILFNNGARFIDARDDFDYNEGHIFKAINIPFYAFEENEEKLNGISKDEAIVTYCNGSDCDLSVLLGNKLARDGL